MLTVGVVLGGFLIIVSFYLYIRMVDLSNRIDRYVETLNEEKVLDEPVDEQLTLWYGTKAQVRAHK